MMRTEIQQRLLVLVPAVPETKSKPVPWHFFQELEPLVRAGHAVAVVSQTLPKFELSGVEFFRLELPPMTRVPGEVFAALRYGARIRRWLPDGAPQFSRRMFRLIRWNLGLSRIIESWRPTVIHSHWAFPVGSGGYLAAKASSVPLVMTLRGIEHQILPQFGFGDCLDPMIERSLTMALRHCSAVTVCCQDSIARLKELGVYDASKIEMVYHAVDPERLREDSDTIARLTNELGLHGRRVVGCVAGMDGLRKGQRTLIDAMTRLPEGYGDLVVVFVGNGTERLALAKYAEDRGVSQRVVFAGALHPTEVGSFMRMCACTVLPTFSEAFGNVVFESLLVGTPVIAARVGAPGDVLREKGFGATFTAGNVAELVDQLCRVMDGHDNWAARAHDGGEFVRREMSLARRIEGFSKIYGRIAPE